MAGVGWGVNDIQIRSDKPTPGLQLGLIYFHSTGLGLKPFGLEKLYMITTLGIFTLPSSNTTLAEAGLS